MSPILQALIALAIRILLCLLLLSKMTLAVRDHSPHMIDIIYLPSVPLPTKHDAMANQSPPSNKHKHADKKKKENEAINAESPHHK